LVAYRVPEGGETKRKVRRPSIKGYDEKLVGKEIGQVVGTRVRIKKGQKLRGLGTIQYVGGNDALNS